MSQDKHPSRQIGVDKPVVQYTAQTPDPYYWPRRQAAKKLNYDEEELNDEPDFDIRIDNADD